MDMKVVTICGSMKFSKEMRKIATELECLKGYTVIQCVYIDELENDDNYNKINFNKVDFDSAHRKKIDISDAIYVVNIGGYIGNSTKQEISYAISNGKEVMYHESVE